MDLARIRTRIREIAASPKNVDFAEFVSFLNNHIGPMYSNYNHHGNPHHAFTLGTATFNVAQPKRGCVKKIYIEKFLQAMESLGLYEPEENDEKS